MEPQVVPVSMFIAVDPAIIQLCDSTCAAVQQDDGASVEVVLGCQTVVM